MKPLSKSQYVRGRQCVKSLWLYRHRKELADPVDEFQQQVFDKGTEFGKLAMQRFPGGVLIEQGHDDPEGAIAATTAAMNAGVRVIYEAAFLHDDVLVRADVLVRGGIDESSGRPTAWWDLYEVKSSTKVTDVYLEDVAIQRYVLKGAGLDVRRAFVAHANSAYVRRGALDLNALFAIEDVTEASRDACLDVPATLKMLKQFADGAEAPPKGIGDHCAKPYGCDFRGHCWAHVPEYSVFDIPYAKMDKKLELFNRGILRVKDVDPGWTGLSDKRSIRAVETARLGRPAVDAKAIAKFLNGLTYPLAHLDFETEALVVPPYDGLRPYSQMPFQASVRVQQERGGTVVESGFLGDGLSDPRDGVTDFLLRALPPRGTILAYYKPFEAGRIKELAEEPSARPLLDALERLQDLADPFSKGWYAHPDFLGKWSIKNVLPVLVPSMTYANLVIKNGTEAMAAYAELRDPATSDERRAVLAAALKVYCGQDTEAMVQILAHLYEVVGQVAA